MDKQIAQQNNQNDEQDFSVSDFVIHLEGGFLLFVALLPWNLFFRQETLVWNI